MGVNSNGTTMMDQGVFENLGSVTWDTTAKTTGFTAVSGNGYFVNTTSGSITVTLPATPSAGDVVGIKDYANTADTNAIVIGRNGSNINGDASDYQITTEGLSAILVYVDATKGWLITNASQASDISEGPSFITATGGTVTECGDFKIHTFTGPGTFCVSSLANCVPGSGPNNVDYLVVAGGGGGGVVVGGGAGAGGYRTSFPTCGGSLPISVTAYPIQVGGGGAVGSFPGTPGTNGSNSVFSTITSSGGGGGGTYPAAPGASGGSGGGGGGAEATNGAGGTGNTPPVAPPQGNSGGAGRASNPTGNGPTYAAGGGGGAGAAGVSAANPGTAGDGGNGLANSITGSSLTYAGGGGGGGGGGPTSCGIGGTGGGGAGSCCTATPGTINTGGGGGGTRTPTNAGTGGSGIVIIRYKYQ